MLSSAMPARRLPTTRWSVVLSAAGDRSDPIVQRSLEELCQSYWPPLYAYLRRRGLRPEDAEDCIQDFFSELLRREDIAKADSTRGRFRAFLFASLDHFLSKRFRGERAQRRGGDVRTFSLAYLARDRDQAETLVDWEPADERHDPARMFDRDWARWLVAQTLSQLRAEYVATGKGAWFDELQSVLTGSGDFPDRAAVSARLGISATAMKVAIHRLRQRYRQRLIAAVAETLENPGDVGQERRALFEALE